MFHDAAAEPPPDVRELMERASPEFIEALQAVGLYVESRVITTQEDVEPRAALLVGGRLGEVAFSERVLRPQAVQDGEVLEEIAEATVADEYERNRRRLLGLDDE